MRIFWSTKSVSITGGYGQFVITEWYGDDIVEIWALADSNGSSATLQIIFEPEGSDGSWSSGDGKAVIEATAVMVEENVSYPTPYIPTSRSGSELTYNYSLPNQGTFEGWFQTVYGDTNNLTYSKFFTFIEGYNSTTQWWAQNHFSFSWYNTTGELLLELWDSDGTQHYSTTTITWNAYEWYHIKVTWENLNSGDSDAEIKVYKNGSLISGLTISSFVGDIHCEKIIIGANGIENNGEAIGQQLDGYITDLIIKDYVDTSTEHYEKNIPYKDKASIVGKNSKWKFK